MVLPMPCIKPSADLPDWIDGISAGDMETVAQRLGVTADGIRNGEVNLRMDAAGVMGDIAVERHGYVSKEKQRWADDQFRPLD